MERSHLFLLFPVASPIPATPDFLLLEDNISFVLLEDGTSFIQLET